MATTDTSSYADARVIPLVQLPAQVPRQTYRQAQSNIPDDKAVRIRLKRLAEQHVERVGAVPPLTLDELSEHTAAVLAEAGLDPVYGDYASILVSNAAWRDSLAQIPYERRLLLIPKSFGYQAIHGRTFTQVGHMLPYLFERRQCVAITILPSLSVI